MKYSRTITSLMFLLPLISCADLQTNNNIESTKFAANSIRKIELERGCQANDINDNGDILISCDLGDENEGSTKFEILSPDGSRREIFKQRKSQAFNLCGFGNDGSLVATLFSDRDDSEVSLYIKDGKAVNLFQPPGVMLTPMSPNGKFFAVDELTSNQIYLFENNVKRPIANIPAGIKAGSPDGITDSGDVVGTIASKSSKTPTIYKVVDGRFELIEFADRKGLKSMYPASINSNHDILLDFDTGETVDFPASPHNRYSATSFPLSETAILHTNGEIENIEYHSPRASILGSEINDNGIVLGTIDAFKFFVYGKNKQVVEVDSLIPLAADQAIDSCVLNNRDELLVTTSIEKPIENEPSSITRKFIWYVLKL